MSEWYHPDLSNVIAAIEAAAAPYPEPWKGLILAHGVLVVASPIVREAIEKGLLEDWDCTNAKKHLDAISALMFARLVPALQCRDVVDEVLARLESTAKLRLKNRQ